MKKDLFILQAFFMFTTSTSDYKKYLLKYIDASLIKKVTELFYQHNIQFRKLRVLKGPIPSLKKLR